MALFGAINVVSGIKNIVFGNSIKFWVVEPFGPKVKYEAVALKRDPAIQKVSIYVLFRDGIIFRTH